MLPFTSTVGRNLRQKIQKRVGCFLSLFWSSFRPGCFHVSFSAGGGLWTLNVDVKLAGQYFSAALRMRNVSAFSIQLCWRAAARARGRLSLTGKKKKTSNYLNASCWSGPPPGMKGMPPGMKGMGPPPGMGSLLRCTAPDS